MGPSMKQTSDLDGSRTSFFGASSASHWMMHNMSTTEKKPLSSSQVSDTNCFRYINAKRSALSQIAAGLTQSLLALDEGMLFMMPIVVLGALHNHPSEELCMNDEQASWFGSIMLFSHPIGCVVSGILQDKWGRKGTMMLLNIPILASWSTLYFGNSIYMLYLSQLIAGFCNGCASVKSYTGEMSEPHLRGTLSTLTASVFVFGTIAMLVIAYFAYWRIAALVSSAVPVITFVCMSQVPESPTWLITQDRLKDAQNSLCWLRGWTNPEEVRQEFEQLLNYVKKSPDSSHADSHTKGKYEMVPANAEEKIHIECEGEDSFLKKQFRELTDKKLLHPLRMVFIIMSVSNSVGLIAMRPYMIGVLDGFGFPVDSKLILILTRVSAFAGGIINMIILRRLGKRKISLISQGTATLCILLLGIYCSLFDHSNQVQSLAWIPVSLIVLNVFFGRCGIALLPWQLLCEVFPVKGRGTVTGISVAGSYSVVFLMSKTYLYLEHWIKLNGVFFLYGGVALWGFWYMFRYLPETEGKSLEQIESYFTKNCDKAEKFSKPKRKINTQSST